MLARALTSWTQLPGIKADIRLDRFDLEPPRGGRLFKSAVWYRCLLRKCEYFLDALNTIRDPGVVSVFCDADVQVFPALRQVWGGLVEDMHARDLDCLFMREGASTEVNGGLLVARATARTRAFWAEVVRQFQNDRAVDLGEQTLINRLIAHGGCELRWDYLDADTVVWAARMPEREEDMQKLCFHHAVCADGVAAKGAQMDKVAARVGAVQRGMVHGLNSDSQPLARYRVGRAHIVLCRYDEDVACLQPWLNHPNCQVFVYDRGPTPWRDLPAGVTHVICDNLGREGFVYLEHIVRHYDELADITLFSQCDARDAPDSPVSLLLRARRFVARCHNVGQGFLLATRSCEGEQQGLGYISFPTNSRWWRAWREGSMTGAAMSLAEFYVRFVGPQLPPVNRCVTTLTGTFSAGRDTIRGHPVEYYARLQQTLRAPNPEYGHYVERLWAHIMLGPHAALCVRENFIVS